MLVVALFAFCGCGGSGGVPRIVLGQAPRPTTATAAEAGRLVDRALNAQAADCAPSAGLRFHCQLGDLEGSVDIGVTPTGGKFAILGCESAAAVCTLRNPRSAHRTVAQEPPAAYHAAVLLDRGFGGLSHATCARTAGRHFNCDATFSEEGMRDALNLEVEIDERDFHFVRDCRITKVFVRDRGPFPCQRLAWNLNFPESESREM
ncbi:MAG: hypothetical protein ACRDPE_05090 [Solirubrobacterales bacterium]